MTLVLILLCCGFFLLPDVVAGICSGDTIPITEGEIIEATTTSRSIQEEADEDKESKLFEALNSMTTAQNYHEILNKGKSLGLSTDETQAVRLYTMDTTKLFKEFNTGLREGNRKYPVLHFWLDSALKTLPKYNDFLYHGYEFVAQIDVDTKLRLPGFTSASEDIDVAKGFSGKGCTILKFDSSKQAGSVIDLSEFPKELEHLIPPTERFEVYNKTSDSEYYYIHLRPIGKGMPSATYSPVLIILVVIQTFF